MLKNLNIPNKNLIIAGSVLLFLLCYQLAFKKTITAFQLSQELQSKLTQVPDLSDQPGYLKRKSKNLDLILNRYRLDSLALRGNTLAEISSAAGKENVKLSGVPVEDPSFHTDQFIVERLDFEGGFTSLVKILDHLKSGSNGVPRSVVIRSAKSNEQPDPTGKLSMEVLLEISKE
jgi:hypothetical protein